MAIGLAGLPWTHLQAQRTKEEFRSGLEKKLCTPPPPPRLCLKFCSCNCLDLQLGSRSWCQHKEEFYAVVEFWWWIWWGLNQCWAVLGFYEEPVVLVLKRRKRNGSGFQTPVPVLEKEIQVSILEIRPGSGFLGNSSLKPAVNSQLIPGSKPFFFPKKIYFQKFWFQFQN